MNIVLEPNTPHAIIAKIFVCVIIFASVLYWPLSYFIPLFGEYYYPFLAVVAFVIICSLRFPIDARLFAIVSFGIYMSVVSLIGVGVSGNARHAVQIVSYLLLPLSIFIAGYNCSGSVVKNCLVALIIVMTGFVLLERIEFWFGVDAFGLVDFSSKMKIAFINNMMHLSYSRATGLLVNPNQLGFFAGCALFSFLALSKPPVGVHALAICAACVIVVILSGSRGSLAALAAGTISYMLVGRSAKLLFALGSATFITIALLQIVPDGPSNIDVFVDRLSGGFNIDDTSVTARFSFWSNILANHSVLTGTLAPPELVLGHAIDSFYIRALAQGGIIGLGLSLVCLTLPLRGYRQLSIKQMRAALWALSVFIIVNSFSMLGLMGLESVFTWAVLGQISRQISHGGLVPIKGTHFVSS